MFNSGIVIVLFILLVILIGSSTSRGVYPQRIC